MREREWLVFEVRRVVVIRAHLFELYRFIFPYVSGQILPCLLLDTFNENDKYLKALCERKKACKTEEIYHS